MDRAPSVPGDCVPSPDVELRLLRRKMDAAQALADAHRGGSVLAEDLAAVLALVSSDPIPPEDLERGREFLIAEEIISASVTSHDGPSDSSGFSKTSDPDQPGGGQEQGE